jgi:hypothetical protein
MMARLGPTRAEALRQQVLREQAAALADAAAASTATKRDRTTYTDYPPPKHGRNRK